jgi:hypothetical protein
MLQRHRIDPVFPYGSREAGAASRSSEHARTHAQVAEGIGYGLEELVEQKYDDRGLKKGPRGSAYLYSEYPWQVYA